MKLQKKHIAESSFILYLLYALNHYVFERAFFFNELLALIGFSVFCYELYPREGGIRWPKSTIYLTVCLLIALGAVHLIISWHLKTSLYYYLRNSVIIYSIFTFFLGFYFFPYFQAFIKKWKYVILGYALMTMSLELFSIKTIIFQMDRQVVSSLFPFTVKRGNSMGILIVVFLGIFYTIAYSALTSVVVIGLLLVIHFTKKYANFKMGTSLLALGIVATFLYLSPFLKHYKEGNYTLFGNVIAVYNSNPIFQIDHNTSWRTIFWYRTVVEKFPENLVGIGFGTPLIPYRKGEKTTESNRYDEHDAHVTGAHNTFITLFTRMGLPFLVLILYLYNTVLKEYFRYRRYYTEKNLNQYFWSFFILTIVGFFNLLLETPTLAANYWIVFGFIAGMIEQHRRLLQQN